MKKNVYILVFSLLTMVVYYQLSTNLFAQREMQEVPEMAEEEYVEQPPMEEQPEPEAYEPAAFSREAIEEEIPEVSTSSGTVKEQVQEIANDKITLELKNMDVVEVIKLLSSKGGYDVVVSQNVRGRITLFLDDVPIWDAMQIVFQTTDLAYTKHGDILRIVTEREYEQQYGKKFHDNREVEIISLRYTTANEIGRELKQLKSRIGSIIEDDRTNSVVLLDTPESKNVMKDMISKLDVPVETKVFELMYTPAKSLEEMIKKLISKKGILHVDDLTNKIIITDTEDVIRQVDLVVKEYDKPQYLETKIFTLNYAKFDKVEEKIKDLITKDVGSIKSDERTNKVVVTDLPEKLGEIEKIIAAYDERSREVLIEAKIVQVALSDEFKMGINWQLILNKLWIDKLFNTDTIDMTLSGVYEVLSEIGTSDTDPFDNSVRASHAGGRALVTGTLKEGHDFDAIIDVLKTLGKTNLLSSPRILALNNQEALINVGTREAFVTNTVVQSTGTSTTAENVTFVDVGIKLKVTPTIGEDGFVTLKIKPEVSNVARTITTAQGNQIPIVATQEAETVIMVKDGSTVIMGGLIEDQQRKTTQKIPILGSLPILGIPFRREENAVHKNELVIFLTPHIVTGDVDLTTPSPEMVKYLESIKEERQKAADSVNFKEEPKAVPVKKETKKGYKPRK